jgi:hypothetical protein
MEGTTSSAHKPACARKVCPDRATNLLCECPDCAAEPPETTRLSPSVEPRPCSTSLSHFAPRRISGGGAKNRPFAITLQNVVSASHSLRFVKRQSVNQIFGWSGSEFGMTEHHVSPCTSFFPLCASSRQHNILTR